jgi:hypothetical protein
MMGHGLSRVPGAADALMSRAGASPGEPISDMVNLITRSRRRGRAGRTGGGQQAKFAASVVEFVTGDAREVLAALSGPLDFVLIDLWKDLYIPCFDLVYPKLAEGAFVVADNILFPDFWRAEMTAYRQHVGDQPGIESVLLPVGSGIELSRFARDV